MITILPAGMVLVNSVFLPVCVCYFSYSAILFHQNNTSAFKITSSHEESNNINVKKWGFKIGGPKQLLLTPILLPAHEVFFKQLSVCVHFNCYVFLSGSSFRFNFEIIDIYNYYMLTKKFLQPWNRKARNLPIDWVSNAALDRRTSKTRRVCPSK